MGGIHNVYRLRWNETWGKQRVMWCTNVKKLCVPNCSHSFAVGHLLQHRVSSGALSILLASVVGWVSDGGHWSVRIIWLTMLRYSEVKEHVLLMQLFTAAFLHRLLQCFNSFHGWFRSVVLLPAGCAGFTKLLTNGKKLTPSHKKGPRFRRVWP